MPILLVLVSTYFLAKNNAQNKLQQDVKTQLQQVVNELEIILERHAYLPALIADDQTVIDFMTSQSDSQNTDETEDDESHEAQLSRINSSLELTNNTSGASSIFLMRLDGTTVASSNWFSPSSFIGKNFAFRPYFQQAKQNILGRYYGVGAVSGERGYFFARSIHSHEKLVGVIVVKIAMDDIEFTWGVGSMDFIVTDKHGVIFLSSQEQWNLHSLLALSDEQKKEILESRRYGSIDIQPLNNTSVKVKQQSFQSMKINNKSYEMLSKKMILADWDVRVLANHSAMQKSISTTMIVSSLLLLLFTALATVLWKAQQQRKKYQLQIKEELENKVLERTKALKQSQEDLIQAAKMAALGQLSAGITHEINNPLTAIRAYADNARQFLQKDRFEMVESNLSEITKLTESMAAITKQLKSFSRKSKGQITPVLLGHAIDSALSIVNPKLVSRAVICHWDNQEHGANKSVLADEVWLGQILVNLLTNAISATQEEENREIWISIKAHTISTSNSSTSQLCIQVKDNGVGIEDNTLPHIFEPFFTTKPSSKGLGLGLSISFNLAKDMNGSLNAHNHNDGGAIFSLCLPMAE